MKKPFAGAGFGASIFISSSLFLLFPACDRNPGGHGNRSPARLELSKSEFPAALDCELPNIRAKDCPHPSYDTFILTYTVGSGTVFEPPGAITTVPAYPYAGEYRTEPTYTRHFGWVLPQTIRPEGPNYTTAEVTDNPFGAVRTTVRRLENRKLMVSFDNRVGPGARIRITYGDRSGGGPGYLLPTLPLDIDLVVEEDPDNDGNFQPVRAPMPTLRVIGTRLDRFVVTAPSTPASGEFEFIVKAMQGADEPDTSLFRVQNYTGTISFSSSDPDAVLPADYTFTAADRGVRTFPATLSGEGTQTISVRESGSSRSGISNPVRIGHSGKSLFWGVLHQHTNIGTHAVQTQEYAFDYGRNVAGLDFLSLTEHCPSPDFDWLHSSQLAEDRNRPGQFVTFNGYEWGSKLGHRHIIYLDPLREIRFCQLGKADSTTMLIGTLDDLLSALAGKDALAIPHHTAWKVSPEYRLMLGDRHNPNQRLFEIYSKHGSSERFDNAPYTIHGRMEDQMEDGEAFFQNAIAAGYRFGVTSGTDDHWGMPGGQIVYSPTEESDRFYRRKGLTAVYADHLTRESLWEAFNARRTYGTTGARIILDFRVNGSVMGEEIVSTRAPEIRVEAIGTARIDRILIIRNGTRVVHRSEPGSIFARVDFIDRDAAPGMEYSYYVRIEQDDLHLAWSSPVWVRMEAPAAPSD